MYIVIEAPYIESEIVKGCAVTRTYYNFPLLNCSGGVVVLKTCKLKSAIFELCQFLHIMSSLIILK